MNELRIFWRNNHIAIPAASFTEDAYVNISENTLLIEFSQNLNVPANTVRNAQLLAHMERVQKIGGNKVAVGAVVNEFGKRREHRAIHLTTWLEELVGVDSLYIKKPGRTLAQPLSKNCSIDTLAQRNQATTSRENIVTQTPRSLSDTKGTLVAIAPAADRSSSSLIAIIGVEDRHALELSSSLKKKYKLWTFYDVKPGMFIPFMQSLFIKHGDSFQSFYTSGSRPIEIKPCGFSKETEEEREAMLIETPVYTYRADQVLSSDKLACTTESSDSAVSTESINENKKIRISSLTITHRNYSYPMFSYNSPTAAIVPDDDLNYDSNDNSSEESDFDLNYASP